jgi:hypothetical protein
MMKRIIYKLFGIFNLAPKCHLIETVSNVEASDISRTSFEGALLQVKKIGLYPETVIDVGAASGNITKFP